MTETLCINNEVESFVKAVLADIKCNRDDDAERIRAIREGLGIIVKKYGASSYEFNLAMDVFVEEAYKNFASCLEKILGDCDLESPNETELNIAFAAYYALSLIYKKEKNIDGLRELISDKYGELNSYPLRFEVFSRYYKRVGYFEDALSNDSLAINILSSMGINNPAVGVSYASTVCTMFKDKSEYLGDSEKCLAESFVEAAIEYNPNYPKYYFIKAQLLYYLALERSDDDEIRAACEEAIRLIDKEARVKLYIFYKNKNRFVKEQTEEYDKFVKTVKDTQKRRTTARFTECDDVLNAKKLFILNASSRDVCKSENKLPPNPTLRDDDKYFFVSYSSNDFKSVFCDLIELYRKKLPFKYDEHLTNGIKWQEQIESHFKNENCVGAVFYMSKNYLYSDAVCEEIELAKKYNKKSFRVNLEGSTLPSEMLAECIVERYTADPSNYHLPARRMKLFLDFFDDNEPFANKLKENGNEGINHMDALVRDLKNRFPEIIIGD